MSRRESRRNSRGLLWQLSESSAGVEERMRTAFLGICALLALGAMLYFLKAALLPLVLALALKHLLQPMIYVLSVRPLKCGEREFLKDPLCCYSNKATPTWRGKRLQAFCNAACRLQLSRGLAVVVSLLVTFGILAILAAIVADSAHIFADRSDVYAHRLKVILRELLGWIEWMTCSWTPRGCDGFNNSTNATGHNSTDHSPGDAIERMLSKIPISQIVIGLVESLFDMVSNLFLVLLFTVYLLIPTNSESQEGTAGDEEAETDEPHPSSEVDSQILAYIKGKVALSMIVGSFTAFVLMIVGLDLWLVFGVLAFWLNFVPNVGAVVAVILPMPLVMLDPDMSKAAMVLAFVLPFCVHMVVGNVLEPLLFGHSLELQPVLILFSLMVWGSLWGLTGMVLAVPITAVLKIHLSFIDHPVAQSFVRMLEGKKGLRDGEGSHPPGDGGMEPADDAAPLRGSSFSSSCQSGHLASATLPLVVPAPQMRSGSP